MALSEKKIDQTRYKEEIFCSQDGETLEQAAQKCGECLVSGNIQGQAGQGSEQPEVVEDIPVHCSEVRLSDLLKSFPTQIVQWFHVFVILTLVRGCQMRKV